MGGWRGSEKWSERTTNHGEGVKKWTVEVIGGDGREGERWGSGWGWVG